MPREHSNPRDATTTTTTTTTTTSATPALVQIWNGRSSHGKLPLPRIKPCATIADALAMGDIAQVKRLYKVNACKFDARSCEIAAYHGHEACLDYAIAHGAVCTQDAAVYAAAQGHVRVLGYILESVKVRLDVDGCASIMKEAFKRRDEDVLMYMIKNHALDVFPREMAWLAEVYGKLMQDAGCDGRKRRCRAANEADGYEDDDEEDAYDDANGDDNAEDEVNVSDDDDDDSPRQYYLTRDDDEDEEDDVFVREYASYGDSIDGSNG